MKVTVATLQTQVNALITRVTSLETRLTADEAKLTALIAAPNAPPAPVALVAGTFTSTTGFLDWGDAPPTGLISYTLYQSIADAAFLPYAPFTGSPPSSNVSLSGLTPGTKYSFFVVSTNSFGTSAPSNVVVRTTTGADTTPDQFTFVDQTNVALNTVITSAPITVTGINAAAVISIVGGTYSINGGAFTSANGTVNNNDQVRARHTSSGSGGVLVGTTVTIGGTVSDIFSSTTAVLSWITQPGGGSGFDAGETLYVPVGSSLDLSSRISGDLTSLQSITDSIALPAGVTLGINPPQLIAAAGASGSTTGNILTLNLSTAAADWQTRISQPGVVWYHSFDTAAEVNQFRTTGDASTADPAGSINALSAACAWVSSGGADGGGFLQITRPAGSAEAGFWIRPFSPLTGATNGRGVADPADGGALTTQAWSTVQGTTYPLHWSTNAARPGYYGHQSFVTANPTKFDGTDYYIQVRVKTDPRATAPGNFQGRKKVWMTTTTASNPAQEFVIKACRQAGGSSITEGPIGTPNYNDFYINNGATNGDMTQVADEKNGLDIQLGSAIPGVCDPYNRNVGGCWAYATDGSWDTLLIHVTPGDGTTTNKERIEIWAAHQGQTSYTKIWDVHFPVPLDTTTSSSGDPQYAGRNALYLSTYSNGFQMASNSIFVESFDQVIFSKQFIACPQV